MRRDIVVRIVEACKSNYRFSPIRGPRLASSILARIKNCREDDDCLWNFADHTEEYLWISEDTTLKCLHVFAKTTLIRVFGDEFIRGPNEEDTKSIMAKNQARGLLDMHGSINSYDNVGSRLKLIRPKCIYFLEPFCCCFPSNMCVLNTTNTD
jgi:hypothetical protein